MNLPPDVVNRLAPTHGFWDWLYSSAATLIGAAAVLLGAYFAWQAVRRQINANAAQLRQQIDANAANVQSQIAANREDVNAQIAANREDVNSQLAAEAKHRKRAERLNFVTEADAIVHELFDWAGRGGRRETLEAKREEHAFELRAYTIAAKLALIGMTAEAQLLSEYMFQASARAHSRPDGNNLLAKYEETVTALRNAVNG